MKTLVTGATGLVGSNLVRKLLNNNTEVKVLVREKSDTRNIDGLDIERVYGDIRDHESMKAALQGCNVLYQTAGLYVSHAPQKLFFDINVEGTKTALTAALQKGVEKVVHTSSIVAIGHPGQNGKLADEQTEFTWEKTGSPYIFSKYQGEQAAREFIIKGLPLVIVNPAGVIGVHDIKPTPSGQNILSFLNGKLPGYFGGGINMVDAEDVAQGHILAAQKGKIGERYILGGTNLLFKELFDMIAEVAGIPPLRRKFSRSTMMAMAYLSQALSVFTRKPPMVSVIDVRMMVEKELYYDSSKAIRELGYQPTPIKTTLQKTVNWFRENGYVKAKS
jgi:dihydroflavonol-4-reductase